MGSSALSMVGLSLFLMGLIAVLSVAVGMSGVVVTSAVGGEGYNTGVYYDRGGHAVCYANLTGVGESGKVISGEYDYMAYWTNHTGLGLNIPYPMYYDQLGEHAILYKDIIVDTFSGQVPSSAAQYWAHLPNDGGSQITDTIVANLMGGLTAIMITVLAAVLLVSVNVLSTGINAFGTRVLVVTMFFSLMWALVSGMAFVALTSVPFFGWLTYLCLTFMYFFGVWGMVNTGGSF